MTQIFSWIVHTVRARVIVNVVREPKLTAFRVNVCVVGVIQTESPSVAFDGWGEWDGIRNAQYHEHSPACFYSVRLSQCSLISFVQFFRICSPFQKFKPYSHSHHTKNNTNSKSKSSNISQIYRFFFFLVN